MKQNAYPNILQNADVLRRIFVDPWHPDNTNPDLVRTFIAGCYETILPDDIRALNILCHSMGMNPVTLQEWGDEYSVYVTCLNHSEYNKIIVPKQEQFKQNPEALVNWAQKNYEASIPSYVSKLSSSFRQSGSWEEFLQLQQISTRSKENGLM